jgi:DNA gyrase/topoisomerase IV subunit A
MINALEKTKSCYLEYGIHVNSFRSIPSSIDGLKIAQRRIFCTFKKLGNLGEFVSSVAVIGDCLRYYHPHGSSSVYGAIVNMINEVNPLLKGKGNFGFNFKGFTESTNAAAERYTKVGVNKLGEAFLKLYDYAETYTNENDYEEARYIPTPIPYCLIQGTSGMGIGCATDIPSFKLEELVNMVKDIIVGKDSKMIIPYFGGGIVDISDEQLTKLHSEGECALSIKCGYDVEEEKNETKYIINDVPTSFVNLGKLKKVFKNEILAKEVNIKNESQSKIKIIVIRNKKCKLSKEEFEKKLTKGITENTSFKILVSDNGIVRKWTPYQFVKNSVGYALKAYERCLKERLAKLEEDKLFFEIKPKILEYLKSDVEKDAVKRVFIEDLKLTEDQFNKFFSKSLSSLISSKEDINKLNLAIEAVNKDISNINNSFVKNILSFMNVNS